MNMHTPTRNRLPQRRRSINTVISWQSHEVSVTFGFAETGRIQEVFAGNGDGNDLAHLLNDACVIISIASQTGSSLAHLTRSLGTAPDNMGGTRPASLIGAILQEAIRLEREVWE